MEWNEDQFLEQLEQEPVPAQAMIQALAAQPRTGDFLSYAEMLEETLTRKKQYHDALCALALRGGLTGTDTARLNVDELRDAVERILKSDIHLKKLPAEAGFDGSAPAAECLRRLFLLLDLKEGGLCYDRTWGFGVIQRVDYFYKRVTIDFEKKKGHELSFAYAAETLELLPEHHLFTRFHHEQETVREQVKNEPGEVIRAAIRSFGPISVEQLQEKLIPLILPESDWKRFWDGARKTLKKDPLFDIPQKRTEPIRMLSPEERYGQTWYDALASDRDMKSILRKIYALMQDESLDTVNEEQRNIIAERLNFVITGSGYRQIELLVRAVLAAKDMHLANEQVDAERYLSEFLSPANLQTVLESLPQKYITVLLDHLYKTHAEALQDALRKQFTAFHYTLFNEAVQFLLDHGEQELVADTMRRAVDNRETGIPMLYWIFRNRDVVKEWSLGSPSDLARIAMTEMKQVVGGDLLRTQNQLRELCGQPDWLGWATSEMTDLQRREYFNRIKESTAWSSLDRNAVLGQLIKLYPDLEAILLQESEDEEVQTRGPVTSWRSYRERQKQLEKLVQADIPQNSRDIAEARAHGDLRENFEYKAAKEMQTILMRRQAELEQQLKLVQGTDFEGIGAEAAGPATGVIIEYDDGRRETYYILGEWDRDEALSIISSNSQMAKALEGRRPGDAVTVPSEDGAREARLADVMTLPAAVREWIRGEA